MDEDDTPRRPQPPVPQVVTCPNCGEETLTQHSRHWTCTECGWKEERPK